MTFNSIGIMFLFGALTAQTSTPPADSGAAPVADTGFLYKTVTSDEREYAYCVYVPPEYDPVRPWPTILFLHGSGERGSDGFLHTDVGIARTLRRNRKMIPAIVVMPQCVRGGTWTQPAMATMALRCLEDVSRHYHVDHDRLYLTGLSLGGGGVWYLAARVPTAWAAIVPVCAIPGDAAAAGRIAPIPCWAFHGEKDDRVPVGATRTMIDALKSAGGKPRYTEYPGGNHFIWNRVYDDRQLWRWLFEQRRAKRGE